MSYRLYRYAFYFASTPGLRLDRAPTKRFPCRREPVPVAVRDQHIAGRAGATVRLPVVRSRRQALVAERIGPIVAATGGRPARPGQGYRGPAGRQDRLRLAERRCDADSGQ